jgi:hypothetical protein
MINPRWASRELKRGVAVIREGDWVFGINSVAPLLGMKFRVFWVRNFCFLFYPIHITFFIRLRQDTLQLAAERNGEATAP